MVIPPALKSRPFAMYWVGHLVSIAGSQMQLWALYWHLRTLSDQPMVISGIGLVRFLPVILLSLVAGVAADRFDRRKMAILTQFALGIVALVLGVTTAWGVVTLWMIFGLVIMQSVAVAFDGPARQALIPSLVPRKDLPNAYSLTSIASKVGGILGPALCGLLIAFWGLQWAYWINAISYLAVIIALIAMGNVRIESKQKTFERRSSPVSSPGQGRPGTFLGRETIRDIQAGIDFIKNSPIILSVMVLDFCGTFFSSANTLLPFVAKDILQVGPIQYGWLSASQAIGTLMIGIYLSQKTKLHRQGMLISVSVAMFGMATILFGVSTYFWLTMLALILIGVFDGLSTIIRNTVRQILTPDAMRGRMMSITQIFFKGGPQLGEVESGLVAQLLGVPFAIISGGVGCVLTTWFVVRKVPQLWNYNGDEVVKDEPGTPK
jgi:MFS family permease